jgi:hypothetical protein
MPKLDLREFARKGAMVRLAEIREEIRMIRQVFRDLDVPSPDARLRRSLKQNPEAVISPQVSPKKRRLSAKARKAISIRMKKYWANKRNDK